MTENLEFGMRPPARRGHRGLRPGGKAEWPRIGHKAENRSQRKDDRENRLLRDKKVVKLLNAI